MELKVGMKIRRKNASLGAMMPGDTGVITSVGKHAVTVKPDKFDIEGVHDIENIEVIEDEPRPTFELGDKVEAFGLQGVVSRVDNDRHPIRVTFRNNKDETEFFYADGKLLSWHKEPSLKLIEKWKPMRREITMDVKMGQMGLDLGEFKDKKCKILIEEIR